MELSVIDMPKAAGSKEVSSGWIGKGFPPILKEMSISWSQGITQIGPMFEIV